MDISQFFKSVIEQDTSAVVICDTEHIIVYMNRSACERYAKYGGAALVGKSVLDCHNDRSVKLIKEVIEWFKADVSNNSVHSFYNSKENKDVYIVALRNDLGGLIGYYEKHEYRTRDTQPLYQMKAEL